MKTINKIFAVRYFALVVSLLCLVTSCEKDMEGKIYQVSDQMMIDEIMESDPNLSSFLKIVDVAKMRGTIHAYGTYTFFVPTNDAVDAYLAGKGTDLNSISSEDALEMVKYHLVPDTLAKADFIDGRLPAGNFLNTYITTKTVSDNGVKIEVNRQATIIQEDLKAGNGYVHVVDNVLYHSTKSITDVINELSPIEYSLMKQVYAASGFADVLDDAENADNWYTFFIQDNDGFAADNIETIDDLMDRLRENTPNVNEDSLLYNYIAYHCIPNLYYVTDLMFLTGTETMVKNQVIAVSRDLENVILNEYEIEGVLEEGVLIDRESDYTDLTCSNGVIHKINGNIEIVIRPAYRIYWDLADQPEIQALRGFRKAGTTVSYAKGELANVEWNGPYGLTYYSANPSPAIIGKDNQQVYGDYISLRMCTNTASRVDWKTPILTEGQYKVWVCYRSTGGTSMLTNNGQEMLTTFIQEGTDDQILGTVKWVHYMNGPESYGLSDSDDEAFHIKLEQDGQKQYAAQYHTVSASTLLGIIDVETTGSHTLRWEAQAAHNFTPQLDMVQFIPVDDDQRWPRIDVKGKYIYENTPDCEIWPYTDCNAEPDEDE